MNTDQLNSANKLADEIKVLEIHLGYIRDRRAQKHITHKIQYQAGKWSTIDLYAFFVDIDFIDIYVMKAERHLVDLKNKFSAL